MLVSTTLLLVAPGGALVWVIAAGWANGTLFTLAMTLPLDVADTPGAVGGIAGMMLGVGYVGIAVAPIALGAISDATGGFEPCCGSPSRRHFAPCLHAGRLRLAGAARRPADRDPAPIARRRGIVVGPFGAQEGRWPRPASTTSASPRSIWRSRCASTPSSSASSASRHRTSVSASSGCAPATCRCTSSRATPTAPPYHHFGFTVYELRGALRASEGPGIHDAVPPFAQVTELPDGGAQMYLRDPGGNLIELDTPDASGSTATW